MMTKYTMVSWMAIFEQKNGSKYKKKWKNKETWKKDRLLVNNKMENIVSEIGSIKSKY